MSKVRLFSEPLGCLHRHLTGLNSTVFGFAVLCVLNGSASGRTWFASTQGESTNGTYELPWSVEYAVGKTSNPLLKPGDTVIFKAPGTYQCSETNTVYDVGSALEFRISGTPEAKITYQASRLWNFSFDGGLLFTPSVSNLVIKGLRIFSSSSTNRVRTNQFALPPGISHYGQNIDILHNLIENTGHPGIGSWKTTQGKYIAGNIIRFTGYNDYTSTYNGAKRGSGMYLQNQDNSNEALIQGNISYFNYTTGMKAYGNTDIWNFRFNENICVNNQEAGIFYHQDDYGCAGVSLTSNYLWNNGCGARLGYPLGRGGHSNAVVIGNYIVDSNYPLYMVNGWKTCTITNNFLCSPNLKYVTLMETVESSGISTHAIDHNAYYYGNYAPYHGGPFGLTNGWIDFDRWKSSINGDNNSIALQALPASNVLFVNKPSSDNDFVHVVVYNWENYSSILCDLSALFSRGDYLSVYDAQEIPTAYAHIDFSGDYIELNLNRSNYARMNGVFEGREWKGFAPQFRAFVIHRTIRPPRNTSLSQP